MKPHLEEKFGPWISAYLERDGNNGYGRCQQASTEMQSAFPELRIVKGHVYTTWGKRAHWWLVTEQGDVVDPTAAQFPNILEYEEWRPGMEVRVGKCMNCGDEIWAPVQTLDTLPPSKSICSPDCEDELNRAFNMERA